MLLPETTGEYTFLSAEQDHPLYISIYSAACMPIQDRHPGSASSRHSPNGTPISVDLVSQKVEMPALFQGQFSWQGKILTVDCTLAAANIGSSSINSHSH